MESFYYKINSLANSIYKTTNFFLINFTKKILIILILNTFKSFINILKMSTESMFAQTYDFTNKF